MSVTIVDASSSEGWWHSPEYYSGGRKHEPLDVILDWELSWCLGTVVKYVARAGRKGPPIEDLRKAMVYLQKEIELLEGT